MWSLSQVRSPKHARVIILILFINHKATILAFRCQGVKQGEKLAKESVNKLTAFVYDITQNIACTRDSR